LVVNVCNIGYNRLYRDFDRREKSKQLKIQGFLVDDSLEML